MASDENVNGVMETDTQEKPEKKDEPGKILKGKAHFYFNMNHALRMIIIKPMSVDDIATPEITKWTQRAFHYQFAKQGNAFEAVLYFKTMQEGDEAYADLRANIDNGDTTCVYHPSFPPNLSAWQFWSQLKNVSGIAKAPLTSEEGKQETLFDRQIILENVPESITHEELYEKFPDVPSILIYPHDPTCKGLAMLEFDELEAAKTFYKNFKGKMNVGGNDVKATIFTSRLSAWESTKTPSKMMDPDVSYEDDERIALCEQLQQLESEKDKIMNREDLLGTEKIKVHFEVHEKIKPIQDGLKMDTNRRKLKKLSFPEPEHLQNRYTKFAQSKNFTDKVAKKLTTGGKAPTKPSYRRGGPSSGGYRGRSQMGRSPYGGNTGGRSMSGGYGGHGGYGGGMGQSRGYGLGQGGNYGSAQLSQVIEGITDALQNKMMRMSGGGGMGGGGMGSGGMGGGGMGGGSRMGGGGFMGGGFGSSRMGGAGMW